MKYQTTENVQSIPINEIQPFRNHPFTVADNEDMAKIVESIGKLGLENIPVIVREMTDDEAVIAMVDANLQREHILPSEKAFAYKMKLEAISHQGKACGQVVHKSRDNISDTESGRNVQRYIRLTYLIPELLKLVDEERIAFTPAVELSYLSEYEQQILLEQIEFTDATPSLSQAQRLRKFSKDGNFFVDTVFAVLNEEKPNQKEQVRIPADKLRDVLPKGLDKQKTEDFIIKACEHYRKYLLSSSY